MAAGVRAGPDLHPPVPRRMAGAVDRMLGVVAGEWVALTVLGKWDGRDRPAAALAVAGLSTLAAGAVSFAVANGR